MLRAGETTPLAGAEGSALTTFEIDEADAEWPEVERWIRERNAVDFVRTAFSADEIDEAAWLALTPDWQWGYPQPDPDNFGYLQATYDQRATCAACGVGLRQRAPFRMRSEPKWGRRSVLQLNWVFGEFFVRPDVWREPIREFGVEAMPVLTERGDVELVTVVQLRVLATIAVDVHDRPSERCTTCGVEKWRPWTRGFFPSLAETPETPIVRTTQWFGAGASAFQYVLVSQALRRALVDAAVRGVSYAPVAP